MSAYRQIADGEWVQLGMAHHRRRCCDCVLVHDEQYRILKRKGAVELWMRAVRNVRATSIKRTKLQRPPLKESF
jgi:hypothetical protein